MFSRIKRLLVGTLRRQLIFGMVFIVASVMSLFVWDQTRRQQTMVLEQQIDQAVALARSVATSSAVWVASRDYSGLQEIIDSLSQYPDLRHAIVLDLKGQVLAHNDPTRRGLYLTDLPQETEQKVLQRGTRLVDVATPIMLAGNHIGWVRIGLSGSSLHAKLTQEKRSGIIYALTAIVLSALLATLTGRYLTRRLYAIQKVANAVQAGESGSRAVVPGDDEAAQLARQFNGMLDSLAQRNEQLQGEIAERKRVEEDLRLAKDAAEDSLQNERVLNAAIVESSEDAIVSKTLDGIITSWNRGAEKMFGYTALEMLGQPILALIPPERQDEEEKVLVTIRRGELVKHFETERVCKNGRRIAVSVTVSPIYDKEGRLIGASKVIRDMTERKQMEDQVRNLAYHDALTKLPNRRLLNERLNQAMAASKRSRCYGALMFLDLDNFKSLNDAHGHEVGDLLLIEVADRLKGCVREIDTVARFGGDEFVVLLSELDADKAESVLKAQIVAEKLRITLSEPYLLAIRREGKAGATVEHRCTATIGVALFIDHQASPGDILRWADKAMYQAKEAGRNLIRFCDSRV